MRARLSLSLLFLCPAVALAAPPAVGNLNGLHLTLGPLAGVVHGDTGWTSATGVELSVLRVREEDRLAALGVALGGVGYTDRAGGRFWLEAEASLAAPLPVAVGLGVGPTLDVDRVQPPRIGGQATLWLFLGIVPYVRIGTLAETGVFWEAGAMIKLPIARFLGQ